MADLKSILTDQNYVNANSATKAAIFNKYAQQDANYVNANPETQNAIRIKFGVESTQSKPAKAPERTWGDVAGEAITNIPSSVGGIVSGIAQAVRHPIDTAGNLLDVAAGGLQHALPESLVSAVNKLDPNAESARVAREKASAVGGFYKQRYGSEQGLKEAIATDPAGVAADVASVLTGGGALASKIPGMAKASNALSRAGVAIDPLSNALRAGVKGTELIGKGASALLGNLTGAGSEAIKQAYLSGKEGGTSAASFKSNIRGESPMSDVLDTAKTDLAAMNKAKTAEYRKSMDAIKTDKTVLQFDGIGDAVKNAYDTVTYKGQIKNAKAADVVKKISDEIGNWRELNPTEFHTPEGLDALKQVVGGIVESIPFEEKTARMVGGNIYNSIKSEIAKQAPTYAKTMKDYSEATEQIKEIERALLGGNKAAADTSLRKLQSLMRNNVSTNYGNRLDLAQQLQQAGGKEFLPAIAGQSLSSLTPRGLQGLGAAGTIGLGALTGSMYAAPLLAAQSPRLVGEAALAVGQGGKIVGKSSEALNKLAKSMNVSPTIAANMLYQVGATQQRGQK